MNLGFAISPKLLARARVLNPVYQERLGWSVPQGWPTDVRSEAFALTVAHLQFDLGLTVDGTRGPKTLAAEGGATVYVPPAGEYLIVGGERFPVSFPVVTWEEPGGYGFKEGTHYRQRKDPSGRGVSLFVIHWDVSTSSAQCWHALIDRGLSVHLMLDADGTVYQALDLASARAWHAGTVNDRSAGVEICNPVSVARNKYCKPPREQATSTGIHMGPPYTHLDFYDIQKQRAVELTLAVTEALKIQRKLPLDPLGKVLHTRIENDFAGVCGHYHIDRTKVDPGLTLWPGLLEAFA